MADLPIIFSAAMVQGLLREAREPGTGKTMTRRLLYSDRIAKNGIVPASITFLESHKPPVPKFCHYWALMPWHKVKAGDRLWVREAAYFTIDQGTGKPAKTERYMADGPNPYKDNFTVESRSSIHMPRWASRLTLIVTATKIERLQDITETDARAESAALAMAGVGFNGVPERTHRTGFVRLWGSLHGVESWLDNPFVVVLTFRVILANIDAIE